MIFGTDYYPEHWDKSEWALHARLMREANINTVRIAEFAWKLIEPEEDVFDFGWLDEVIDTLSREGIKVILGTPTAAPPKWLVNKYDVLIRDKFGRERGYGSRRECCANSVDYIGRSMAVVEKMAKHYAKNENVAAWQIDNEFGCHNTARCCCESCKRAFSKWLSEKFSDIDELNERYGTVFWSQIYDSFDDVILPAYSSCDALYSDQRNHNPSLELDYYRFSSDSWVKFQNMQIDIIKKYTDKPVTHNLMGHFSDINYYDLAEKLDIVSWDNYPDNQWGNSEHEYVSMAHELMRGVKNKNFWVMEEQAGPAGWDVFGGTPRPGQIRLWTYQALSHGCEGILYFRFKSALRGMEQYWLGILDHDGIPRRRYYEIQKIGEEIASHADLFEGAENVSDTLIVKSYENEWSHSIKRSVDGFNYTGILYDYFKANSRCGINAECGSEEMISDKYKVVYMPACAMVSDKTAARLEEYVSNGGTLVLTFRSGVKDTDNNILPDTVPGKLRALAKITAQEFDSSKTEVPLTNGFGSSRLWRDIIVNEGARVISAYDGEFYSGSPAVTHADFGKGAVWYVGCDLDMPSLEKLVKLAAEEAGVRRFQKKEGTELVLRRTKDGREYLSLMNFTEKCADTGIKGRSLLNGTDFDGILPPFGAEIIEYRG